MGETTDNLGHDDYECVNNNNNLLARTGCILSYNNSMKDVIVNYMVLLVNLVYCCAVVVARSQQPQARQHDKQFAIGAFVFVVFFQIILCLILGCSGISIIWCALGGWAMSERRKIDSNNINQETPQPSPASSFSLQYDGGTFVILLDCAVIAYYAVVTEPITTIAHFCALVMGATLSLIMSSSHNRSSREYYNDVPSDVAAAQPLVSTTTTS